MNAWALALAVPAVALAGLGYGLALAQDEGKQGPLAFQILLGERVATWTDASNEASYRISGQVDYLTCDPATNEVIDEVIKISEELPANTTSFQLPPPTKPGASSAHGATLRVEALAEDGTVLVEDGQGFIADGPVCTEAFPDAGDGPGGGNNAPWLLFAVAALGAAAIVAGGLALRGAA